MVWYREGRYRMTNYHTHTPFCDGREAPEVYADTAIRKGFRSLGFSGHAPLPFPNHWTMKDEGVPGYLAAIRALRDDCRGRIEILLGMEIDYLPGVMGPSDQVYRDMGLDFVIGSVHMIPDGTGGYPSVDGPVEEYRHLVENVFGGSPEAFVRAYFSLLAEMTERHRPDIVGHFDLVQKNNTKLRYFSGGEPWYREAATVALDAAARTGSIVEVNTGGMARGRTDRPYPDPWILSECRRREIPVTLNADAHAPEHLDAFFPEALRLIADTGYRELRILRDGEWVPQTLEEWALRRTPAP